MPNSTKTLDGKLKLAAKVLFELPPSDTLPVFKRLSIADIRTLLDQIKDGSSKGRGLAPNGSSLPKLNVCKATHSESTNRRHRQIDEFKKQAPVVIENKDCQHADQLVSHTNSSMTDMKPFIALTDDEIKIVLKHCDTSFWAPALKNAPVSIQQKIMSCMAPAAAGLLKVEIDKVCDINKWDEKLARQNIIQTAIRLAAKDQSAPQSRIHESEAA